MTGQIEKYNKQKSGTTVRAIIIGLLLTIVNCYWVMMSLMWGGGESATITLIYNVVFTVFVLILINFFCLRFLPRFSFSQGEFLSIYVMLNMASVLASHFTIQVLVPIIPHAFWFATPENEWKELFWKYIPRWLSIADKNALSDYYRGESTVEKGQLVLGANKWAITTGYKGPEIKEKTLVAWVYIDDLNITHGAPIAIQQTDADSFDAIVYAERQPRQWMAGSSHFIRTQDAVPGFKETETGKLVYMAISYEDDGGDAHVRIYRNGDLIGDYTKGFMASWVAGNVEALFGIRACFITVIGKQFQDLTCLL
ncbi:MAG: DUF6785 family protein [Candidatus Poribacteria bacterium]